ncbi:hypothetical protein J7T55_003969 [Diaporthe amygdali]|uniref:uncharacterized protein n=1 Tax=Phomopsis amygdali TaxID=1214568 RepID=UPI0022FE24A6|nr:uncharacterized protein J7T55_003969 [Diaporthe amygdali]KAJ0115800.1 hypothetical protein J7T55_003969 [Diaporthe amygdali]
MAAVPAVTSAKPVDGMLPAVPEDIVAEWLTHVFGQQVKSVEITRVVHGTASKVFATVVFDDDNISTASRPTFLCIKGGFDPKIIAHYPWIVNIYFREVEFFNRVAPNLAQISLPRSHWAGHNGVDQGIVIMDDLDAPGCQFGDPAQPWPVSRALAGVEQLAALHAGTWNAKAEDYPWLTAHYDQAILSLMETYEAVVRADDRPPGIHEYLKDQKRMTAALNKHYQSRNPVFQCLVHGDPHTGNTYLVQDQPRFLDWQVIHIGSAFHDVAYFIGGALTIEDRRAHEMEILDHYLEKLASSGAPAFSSSQRHVLDEYRKSFLAGVGWIMCPYVMQPREQVHAMAVRYAAALDDHKTIELVESLTDVE